MTQIAFHFDYGFDCRVDVLFRDSFEHLLHYQARLFIVFFAEFEAGVCKDDALLAFVGLVFLELDEVFLFQLEEDLLYVLVGTSKNVGQLV